MANKFTMKETTVENKIEYIVYVANLHLITTNNRLEAYEKFDLMKEKGYTNIVLKKVITNVETEYLERG